MEIEFVNDLDSLKQLPNEIYIYGTKTIAGRLYFHCQLQRIKVSGFLVSKRYQNPSSFWGISVTHIEDITDKELGCVVLAVGHNLIEECIESLSVYRINRLVIVSYLLDKKLTGDYRLNPNCQISDRAMIAPNTNIYADETSNIYIGEYACISGGDIFATNHSKIIIEKSVLAETIYVHATNSSAITLGKKAVVGHDVTIDAVSEAVIEIGTQTVIGYNTEIGRKFSTSRIHLDQGCFIGHDSSLGGNLYIGEKSGFAQFSSLGGATVGKNCMFSSFIRFIGNHKMFDGEGNAITKRGEIIIGNHVWAGMGATFMPGCSVREGSIVGTSAMVMGVIPENTVCVGIPARVIRKNIHWRV